MRRLLVRLAILGICLAGSQMLLHETRAAAADRLSRELIEACGEGDLPRVKAALARGADINRGPRPPKPGPGCNVPIPRHTPLIAAVGRRSTTLVTYLLDQGADVNRPSSWDATPLSYAAYIGDVGMFRLLLQRGARKDSVDEEGHTLLEQVKQWRKSSAESAKDAPNKHLKTIRAELDRYDTLIRLLEAPHTDEQWAAKS